VQAEAGVKTRSAKPSAKGPTASRKKAVKSPVPKKKNDSSVSRFQKDLETRGEALQLDEEGKLPLSATHAIITKPDGTREVKRARLKLF
jgi:hypothetical protein